MAKIIKLLLVLLLLMVIAVPLAFMFSPWKKWVEEKVIALAEAEGFKNVQLTVDDVGLSGITLKNVSVGADNPLRFDTLTISYSLHDLKEGKLKSLNLSGLNFDVNRKNGEWGVAGFESRKKSAPAAMQIPVTGVELIELEEASLGNSQVLVNGGNWQTELALGLVWKKTLEVKLAYDGDYFRFNSKAIKIETGKINTTVQLDEKAKQWNGSWGIAGINVGGTQLNLPPLAAKGSIQAKSDRIIVSGHITSEDSSYNAEFNLNYLLSTPEKSPLVITYVSFPWNGGILSAKDVRMLLTEKQSVDVILNVQKVSINELMKALTGNRATGSGMVTGVMPVTYTPEGKILLHEAALKAEAPGIINMQPDVIPGDNPQVTLVRDVLKNLHYNLLSISMNSSGDNKMTVSLRIEGNNPDVYNGKPVKLNVNLSGDILDLIQQSVMTVTNPEQLLRRGENEKK